MTRWRTGRTGQAASLAVACLLHLAGCAQAQGVDGDLYKSVEACQKVVKRHTILSEGTTQSTLQQLMETNSTMEGYLRQWGARVVAGAPAGTDIADAILVCQQEYVKSAEAVRAKLEDKLRQSIVRQIAWYDEKIFSLFTDVLSDQGMAGVVQTVQSHLEPTLKQFDSEAVSGLKQSVKDLKPAYQTASKCIRDLSLQSDDFPERYE
ncbi:uncharacterized protein LOC117641485 [Thrips palmi]|uniref:Uncharacterized protein LOC117641485 n=1 Tax=Thrips palmi TaxID=161013 RepID=A0A6P8Y591_THRPL|nr:uncharacterized protein LOC117641485 [Thrips palmi]